MFQHRYMSTVLAVVFPFAVACSSGSSNITNRGVDIVDGSTGGSTASRSDAVSGSGAIAATGNPSGSAGGTGSGGLSGTGGAVVKGGSANAGGAIASGGSLELAGGSLGTGGTVVQGSTASAGGFAATGGYVAKGGASGLGGLVATGGSVTKGGSTASGGLTGAGGSVLTGGFTGVGGVMATGGSAPSSGGASGGALPAITLWLAGDSTVQDNGPGKLPEGWGTEIGQFFTSKVTVVDKAIGGRNVQTFMYTDASRTTETTTWASMKSSMKPGDYFMVQFGANDSSPGSERYLTPATYETLLGVMVDAVRAKQVTPILVTPSCLQIWVDGKIDNSRLAPYVAAMIGLGAKKNVLVDDLNARSVEYVNSLGRTAANAQIYYDNDKAHFTKAGATQMAQFVVNELKRIGSPLAAYVK